MTASRLGLLVSAAGGLALAACATADLRPGIVRHETPKQIRQKFHGPDVRIRASVKDANNARLITPVVTLADSAYLVIGDIGDDGTMRIVYPAHPGEPNLIRRGRSFEGPTFQPRVILPFMPAGPVNAVTRTAPGYTFVIASSLPLDLTKLADGERWSMFDVYYDNHMVDPRPAITDLAAAISSDVGQVSISYAAYAWGFIGPRAVEAQQAVDEQRRRSRLPRPPL